MLVRFTRSSLTGGLFIAVAVPMLLARAAAGVENQEVLRLPVPINCAEAIIEPFWSEGVSGFSKWTVEDGAAHGLYIHQHWFTVDFEWGRKPAQGPALRMWRDFNVDCSRYNRLILRMVGPRDAVMHIRVETDKGARETSSQPFAGEEIEIFLDLEGAQVIHRITLELEARQEGSAVGWLRWVGLQHTERLKDYFAQWDMRGVSWENQLKAPSYEPSFEPLYGIFLTPEELAAKRQEHEKDMAGKGKSRYSQLAEAAKSYDFERGIEEFARSGGDNKGEGRTRDAERFPMPGSPGLAEAALVVRDAGALRAAARYALCLAACQYWDDGFMAYYTGSDWDNRAFRRSYITEDVAYLADAAGEMFTENGRLYLMRRLAEEGVGRINFVLWRHEYVFHCNQLGFFNTGRMAAYLVMERQWPRVRPYTDLAYDDIVDNLNLVIQPDGGYLETPSYFGSTSNRNLRTIEWYARARGKDATALTPEPLTRTGNYAAVIMSTTDREIIPYGDSDLDMGGETLERMHAMLPGSYWTSLYNKCRVRNGMPPLEISGPALPAFISLPDTGLMASVRELGGQPVKLFLMGYRVGCEHTHEDIGSFVLEFGGQSFAADLGICTYSDPIHHVYKQAQRHNMLAPYGTPDRPHPVRPLPVDVKPAGEGDEMRFKARLDATAGWDGFYKKWVRQWESPSPDTLIIRDEYELGKGDGVEFYWQTMLPCRLDGQTLTIAGDKGTVTIAAPEGTSVRLETLPLHGGESHQRIAIRKEGTSGSVEVLARLAPKTL
ncbi:MAG TPA: heparinase II/III family protein [Candidatus Hydrogenedentes bacterium]|nr:heparinase II/III family protein [Candidatus Hydrogenedentota bacterium]HQH68529.1 heparinase II/III family protein [Candidatus Hydrogenedentota bacterium]HQM50852.1 heparinase II/III family protein [Candidatus Hydrogenedentota bacterium]